MVSPSRNAGLLDDQNNTEVDNNAKDNTRNIDLGKKLNTIEATIPSVDAADSGPEGWWYSKKKRDMRFTATL